MPLYLVVSGIVDGPPLEGHPAQRSVGLDMMDKDSDVEYKQWLQQIHLRDI